MSCKSIEKYICKYIDGEINQKEFHEFESHINQCEYCKDFYFRSVKINKHLQNISVPLSKKNFSDFEYKIPEILVHSKISYWFIAASILFAAIIGSTLGICVNFENPDNTFASYTKSDITYVSMFDIND